MAATATDYSVLIATDPDPPHPLYGGGSVATLTISQAQLPDAATVTLTGTIDADDAGLTISIYDGATLLGVATTGGDDVWTYDAAVSGPGLYAFSAKASGADDETLSSATAYLAAGGGQSINFADPAGDSASLYETGGDWDLVNGSNGQIYLSEVQASVVGQDDAITLTGASPDTVSLYDTGGQGDAVTGYDDAIVLTNAQAAVSGGYNTIFFEGAGNSASLSTTGGNWDLVYGDDGALTLIAAQASVIGGDDTIALTGAGGDALSLYNTGVQGDAVTGDDASIVLTDAWASITGGYNTVYVSGDDDWANLYATNGHWDNVYGHDNDDSVTLNSAQASVIGNLQVNLIGASRDYLSLYDTQGAVPEYVNALNAQNGYIGNETIAHYDANAIVSGENNTIFLEGASGNQLTVEETIGGYGDWDWAYGDDGLINVLSANISVIGGDDTVYFGDFPYSPNGDNEVSLYQGGSDLLEFRPGIGGAQQVAGFVSSDVIQLSAADFANFAAVSAHLSQTDAGAVITLDAADTITLIGVSASSLTSAQFSFV